MVILYTYFDTTKLYPVLVVLLDCKSRSPTGQSSYHLFRKPFFHAKHVKKTFLGFTFFPFLCLVLFWMELLYHIQMKCKLSDCLLITYLILARGLKFTSYPHSKSRPIIHCTPITCVDVIN
jgi:hypothetical protein